MSKDWSDLSLSVNNVFSLGLFLRKRFMTKQCLVGFCCCWCFGAWQSFRNILGYSSKFHLLCLREESHCGLVCHEAEKRMTSSHFGWISPVNVSAVYSGSNGSRLRSSRLTLTEVRCEMSNCRNTVHSQCAVRELKCLFMAIYSWSSALNFRLWYHITPCQKRWPGSRAAGCLESHYWTEFTLL